MNIKLCKPKVAALPHIDINSGQLSMEPSYNDFLYGPTQLTAAMSKNNGQSVQT